MNNQKNSGELPRRQFVAYSGAVGAAALLTGAGAVGSTAAAAPAARRTPSDPCPSTPPGGGNPSPCPPAQFQPLCGNPTDNDPLWNDVRYCTQGITPPSPQTKPDCLVTARDYVVLHGRPRARTTICWSPVAGSRVSNARLSRLRRRRITGTTHGRPRGAGGASP